MVLLKTVDKTLPGGGGGPGVGGYGVQGVVGSQGWVGMEYRVWWGGMELSV